MFIDCHSHVTWGVDDGVQTKEECQEVLASAKADGFSGIIATPHFIPGRTTKKEMDTISERMDEVEKLADSYGLLYRRGAEVFLNRYFLDMIEDHLFYTLSDSRYLLCEFDVRQDIQSPEKVEDRLYELCIRDYVPLVAHVERYFHKKMDLDRVSQWVEMGCKIQVNRTSLVGLQGKQIKKNAMALLDAGLVHVVATDTHSATGSRVSKLSDAFSILEKRYGQANAERLTYRNPQHILQNEELEDMQKVQKKRLFFF